MPAALLAGAALAFPAPVAAAERLEAQSRWEIETFYFSAEADGASSDWAGLDGAWSAIGRRWSVSVHVPVVMASGPESYVGLGPGFVPLRKGQSGSTTGGGNGSGGSGTGGGSTGGSGSGGSGDGGLGPGAPSAAIAATDPTVSSDARWGMGDVRLEAGGWLSDDGPYGRFRARGGVKLPTADEAKGLGTGETDAWAGFGWRRAGFTTDVEVRLDWVYLGDPEGATYQDGPAGGIALGWTIGRGALWLSADGARAAIAGEPDRWTAGLEYARGAGRAAAWSVRAGAGLTSSVPDLGVSFALRF